MRPIPLLLLAAAACRHDNELSKTAPTDSGVCERVAFFLDADGDGYGDPTSADEACELPSGAVDNGDDCDDTDPSVNPAGVEDCDRIDDDCDGDIDEGLEQTWYPDSDGDGFGDPDVPVEDCVQPAGTTNDNTDCNDANAEVNPAAQEVCNAIDDDCDGLVDTDDDSLDRGGVGTWYVDADGDGYGGAPIESCFQPEDAVDNDDDCDDTDPLIYPGAIVHLATIKVCIDGSDWFVFQGTQGWWEHRNYEKAGLHSGCSFSETIIDGTAWTPTWTGNTSSAYDPMPVTLPAYDTTLSLAITTARGSVSVAQHPDASNSYAGKILLDDDPSGGPDTYELEVSYAACPI